MTTASTTTRRTTMRRKLFGVLTACAVGGAVAAVVVIPSATAAPDPCAASEIARTIGRVSNNTGTYLEAHPQTNAVLSMAAKQEPPQAMATLKSYFDANPQVTKEMSSLQQPLQQLSTQCDLPITGTQALQMLAGMQGQGAQLPGGLTTPGTGGAPGTSPLDTLNAAVTGPGQSAPAATAPPAATGSLPGPATTGTR